MSVQIMIGDVMQQLKKLPADSVDCCVTSPPYWGLRDYGAEGQMGLEKTLGEHIEVMLQVFRQVRRVLKDDGTCWINYGDCYAATPNGRSAADVKALGKDDRAFRDKPFSTIGPIYDISTKTRGGVRGRKEGRPKGDIVAGGVLKPKDLCMIPNRLAIALQDDGWWVRSEIIWHKPNPMPESVNDRPATAHEKIWLLSKSRKYYYDAEAVRQRMAESSVQRLSQDVAAQDGSTRANGGTRADRPMKAVQRTDKQRGHGRRHEGFNKRWDAMPREEQQANGANLKNVWTIPTKGYDEAHFATFPPEVPRRCILAGCPKGGVVLDPFGGSGTTGLVADQLERNAILIELNPEYAEMARRRIQGDAPLFADVQ